jgi:membrane-associated phospholipid phosphatase
MSRRAEGTAHEWVMPVLRTATFLLAVGVLLFGMLLGIGWLCTHVEPGTAVGTADVGILRWLVAHRVPTLDTVSLYAVELASTTTVLVSGAVAGIAAALVLRRMWPLVAVAVARLYRGAHYPTDVLASALFAVPWLLATIKACAPSHNRWVDSEQRHGTWCSSRTRWNSSCGSPVGRHVPPRPGSRDAEGEPVCRPPMSRWRSSAS